MKNFTKRALALALALVLALSVVPGSVYAAVGDVAAGTYAGSTGLSGNIDTSDSINWPIKIYDYLNDGMLFEYSSTGGGNQTSLGNWVYGGGERMPVYGVTGYDYTINGGYISTVSSSTGVSTGTNTAVGSGAYAKATYTRWWGSSSSPFSATQVGKGTAGAFKYLRITLKSGKSLMPMGLTSFYYDNGASTARDGVRYAVIVYRTNIANPSIKLSATTQTTTGATATLKDPAGSSCGSYIPSQSSTALTTSADTWQYTVIDMKEVAGDTWWGNTTSIYTYIIDIEKMAAGGSEYLDISHVAYFSDETVATNYGKDAAKFSNNPGEYLPDQQETIVPYVPEEDEEPEMVPATAPTNTSAYVVDFTEQGTVEQKLITNWTGSGWGWTVTQKTDESKPYIRLSDSDASIRAVPVFRNEVYGESYGIPKSSAKYVTLVYRTHNLSTSSTIGAHGIVSTGSLTYGNYFNRDGGYNQADTGAVSLSLSESDWIYMVYDMSKVTHSIYTSSTNTHILQLALVFPGYTGGTQSIDLAYVDFFSTSAAANEFGVAAAAYMNDGTVASTPSTTPTYGSGYKHWNMTGNVAYAMLFASQGSGWNPITWTDTDGTSYTTDRGGANSWAGGYYSYPIGEHLKGTGLSDKQYKNNIVRDQVPSSLDYVVSDNIFGLQFDSTSSGYKTDDLDIGYQLLTKGTSGLCTIGLLESSLLTVTAGNNNYKILQYKNDTIDYIAQMLEATLTIPQTDKYGNYNYSYIQGSESSQFAYTYDASTGKVTAGITVDGETKSKVDLATGLRTRLGITFRSDMNTAATQPARGKAAQLTAEKRAKLIGDFKDVLPYIETFADAAYYLLHNIFVDNSYSQVQDEYNYLVLSKGTISTTGKEAYVFDGGFSTGTGMTDTNDDKIADGTYAQTSQSAVVFDKTTGTISLSTANSKDLIFFQGLSTTTRFPFLPITDATGDYAGAGDTYFAEDAATELKPNSIGYRDRNYNYVIQANGEFVYHADDALFFDFEGDDDVYLFINGELVLDIGGAHSITKVGFNMNDYVNKARSILVNNANLSGYYSGMSDSEFETLLTASGLDAATKEEYRRWHKLDLADGQSYAIDFYYMERHGYGANMRIATNIVMTDPSMQTEKTAYQNGEEIPYGGVADKDTLVEYGFAITNSGNNKLYDLTFTDSTIGVKLDKTNGLTVSSSAVTDANGGTLDVSDLVINISGYTGPNYSGPISVNVTLADNTALKKFMEDLTSSTTQTDSTSSLYAGSGLWKDGTLTIRGIYVNLNKVTITNDQFPNTVETTAATAIDSATLLNGKDTHMLRTLSDGIQFYQWAGHEIGINRQEIYAQLTKAAKTALLSDTEKKTVDDYLNNKMTYTWFWMVPCLANGTEYTWANVSVDDEHSTVDGIQGNFLWLNYQKAGKYVFYLKIWRSQGTAEPGITSQYAIIPVTVYVTDMKDDVLVLDYGLKADLTGNYGVKAGDTVSFANTYFSIMSMTTDSSNLGYMNYTSDAYSLTNVNRISFPAKSGTSLTAGDGQFDVTDATNDTLTFKPTGFMDEVSTMYMAVTVHDKNKTPSPVGPANTASGGYSIDISKEVQMYQKVTVLPATVVYYEDDFPAIEYADEEGSTLTTTNTFTRVGNWEDLTQSNSQNTPYGSDPYYKSNTNTDMSGGSLTTVTINDTQPFARFAFTGTGFELICRTNATDAGTMEIRVYADANGDGVADGDAIKCLPVITEFDNIATGENGGDEVVHQVPVIRVDDLDMGKYLAVISGAPVWKSDPSTWVSAEGLTFADINNACAAHAEGKLAWKYLDQWKTEGKITADQYTELNSVTGMTRVQKAYALVTPEHDESKIYIDGLRIFHPLGLTNEYYRDDENGATIVEVRQLIMDGYVAFVQYDKSEGLAISSAFSTWTENRDGYVESQGQSEYKGHNVKSLNDYMSDGPNNEVYIRFADNEVERQALVFYVTENKGATDTTLQIGARAVDRELFKGEAFGTLAANLRYALAEEYHGGTGMNGAFLECETINTGTEQYYTIDYTKCPAKEVEQADGTTQLVYEVVITASNDIVSFTSLKYNGLTVSNVNSHSNIENLTLEFENGILVEKNTETGEQSSASYYQTRYPYLSGLMSAGQEADVPAVEPEKPEEPEVPVDSTEPAEPEMPILATPVPTSNGGDFPVATIVLGVLAIGAVVLLAKKFRLFR